MGEVHRARDTRLGRDVAIKVLPDSVARDPDRLARFEREAKTLAALNHPHVAQIYGVEESSGTVALVMELVTGRTLAEIIEHTSAGPAGSAMAGPLGVDEALAIARQIAAALDAAHEAGIVHRDLKPANVKVREDGTVKVLDFGLAKAAPAALEISPAISPDNSPTMISPAHTTQGLILGTAAYMSPEQARGKTVDKRADIWAFGVVLYELLAGRRLFDGETVSDTIAAVLTRSIDLDALPRDVPPHVRALLARCLERDPKRRLRDIGEARVALEEPSSPVSVVVSPRDTPAPSSPASTLPAPARATVRVSRMAIAAWLGVGAVLIAAVVYSMWRRDMPAPIGRSVELDLAAPRGTTLLVGANVGHAVVSPDGTRVAFLASTANGMAIWVRSLGENDARAIAGTETGFYPFWAPDSRRLGFFASGKLLIVDTAGGLPEIIADATYGRGGTWRDADEILFTPYGGSVVHRVAARGGAASPVTSLDLARGENGHYWPVALPGGTKFLYFVRSSQPANNGIYLAHTDGARPPVRLVTSLSSGIFAPAQGDGPGHLLWVRDGELLAQPLDAERGALSGVASVVATDVRVMESQLAVQASVSTTGMLVWARASAAARRLTWYARDGRRGEPLPIEPGFVLQPRISPDGTRLLFTRSSSSSSDIWLHDFASGVTSQVTSTTDYDELPDWLPDGRSMVHFTLRDGRPQTLLVRLDGTAPARELPLNALIGGARVSPDGRQILFTRRGTRPDVDMWVAPIDAPDQGRALTAGPANEIALSFSPDGRWVTFLTDRFGRHGVAAARLFRDAGGLRLGQPIALITGGASATAWTRDGREIVIESADERLLSVRLTIEGDTLTPSPAVPLFALPPTFAGFGNGWAMTSDGSRFIVAETPGAEGQTFHVVSNWQSRLR